MHFITYFVSQSHQAAKRQQPASTNTQGGGGKRVKISAVQDDAGHYDAIKTLAKAAAEVSRLTVQKILL
jgi:hypothetical protein